MYPDSLLWWIGGTAVLVGILGLVGMLAWWVDRRYQRHIEKHHGAPHDEGSTRLGVALLAATAGLVAAGCGLYAAGSVGLAQLAWVLASGSAGAGVMTWIDRGADS